MSHSYERTLRIHAFKALLAQEEKIEKALEEMDKRQTQKRRIRKNIVDLRRDLAWAEQLK
jgi:hypothetical protein